jgi:selenium metabolism protein YedF
LADTATPHGGTMVILNAEFMGRGDDVLGAKLMGSFLRTLATLEPKPEAVVFYNGAVKLLGPGSTNLEALRQLDEAGVDLLACVTCLEFLELTAKMEVGQVSSMREIVQRTLCATKVLAI